ncbi:MAG TPA: Vms1/Ankzf1 family peptidyl-tRNA hydrolase [Ruania sp.]|nr:Vms1/Ankzf1 family peptidyl-tRNA hydrolase [Ruania sp.]
MKAERIADLYTHSGPFATVFLDISKDTESGAHELDVRIKNATGALLSAGATAQVVAVVAERLADTVDVPAPAGRVVVATERGVLLDDVVHTEVSATTAAWEALPDLAAWIECADRAVPHVLALVDHEGGQIATGTERRGEPTAVGQEDPHEQKVRGGGLAHRRMQQTAENVWQENAREVAEEIRSSLRPGLALVVLAGDPASRAQVREELGELDDVQIVELEHSGRASDGGDDTLRAAVAEVIEEHAAAAEQALSSELDERLGQGRGVATGVRDIAEAFVQGQVGTVLIDAEAAAAEPLVPDDHPGLELSAATEMDAVRGDLALIAAAAVTGAETTIVPAPMVRGASAAALLRWSETG